MKSYLSFLLFSLSLVYAQAPSLFQDVQGISLPPYNYTDGTIRYSLFPDFSLPASWSVMNVGGPYQQLTPSSTAAEDQVILDGRLSKLSKGWTHDEPAFNSKNPSWVNPLPESQRVVSVYMDLFNGMPIRRAIPWGNDMVDLDNRINGFVNGINMQFGEPATGILNADALWLNLEMYSTTLPYCFPYECGTTAECHPLVPAAIRCNRPAVEAAYPPEIWNFHTQMLQLFRNHMKPGAKLFLYGSGSGVNAPPSVTLIQLGTPSYAQFLSDINHRDYLWKDWNNGGALGGPSANLLSFSTNAPYPQNDEYWSQCYPSISETDCGNQMRDTLRNPIDVVECLVSLDVQKDYLTTYPAGPQNPLMYFTGLYTYTSWGPRQWFATNTIPGYDAEAQAIFPFMMGGENVLTWFSGMGNDGEQGQGGNSAPNAPHKYYAGWTNQQVQNLINAKLNVYEHFTNGLYRISKVADIIDTADEFYRPSHSYEWLLNNRRAMNYWDGLTPADIDSVFWRAARKGDCILIAAQNPFAPDNDNFITRKQITYNQSGYNFTETIELHGRKVYLALHKLIPVPTSGPCIPLPTTELLSGKALGESNMLYWSITNDLNVREFEIQKASNTLDFQTIATRKYEGLEYSFEDKQPEYEQSYYRIKILSLDGSATYTNVIKIENFHIGTFSLYPNPANEDLYLSLKAELLPADFTIYDIEGRKVLQQHLTEEQLRLNISLLAEGMYHYELLAPTQKITGKLSIK